MTRLSLQLGQCGTGQCALDKSSCNDPDAGWRSPGEMAGKVPYRAHGGVCLLAESVRDMILGRCGGSGDGSGPGLGLGNGSGPGLGVGVAGRCAPNRESCQDADAPFFDEGVPFETSPDCTVEGTTFGKCGSRCAWSPQDCGPGQPWTFPAEGCTCDNVRTGGCVRGDGSGSGDVYCAVSGAGCDDGLKWLSPIEMEAVDAECYVCMEKTVPLEGEGGLIPANAESKEDSSSSSPAVIIGGAVGGALLLALLASLLITRRRKKQAQESKPGDGSHAPSTECPPSDLNLGEVPEMDQVSNLDVEDYTSRDQLP